MKSSLNGRIDCKENVFSVTDVSVRIDLLGEIRIIRGEEVIPRFATQKAEGLLAFLAYRMPVAVPREVLIEEFWPDKDVEAGRNSLRTALSSLRRRLEPVGVRNGSVLQTDRSKACLNPVVVTTDVREFEQLLNATDADETTCCSRLAEAVALYRGDFAPSCYQDWAVHEKHRLEALYLEALIQLATGLEQAGAYSEALDAARKTVELDPFCENRHCALIRLYLVNNQPAQALTAAASLERLFQQEFGAQPSETTQRFLKRLRTSVANRCQGPDIILQADRNIHTAGRSSVPPPLVAPSIRIVRMPETRSTKAPTLQLPLRLTRFFGRTQEIAQILEMLCPEHGTGSRLVTLTGSGGTGKTRLAEVVGRALTARFHGTICFVPLADLTEPAHIPVAILNGLRIPLLADSEPLAQAAAYLREFPTLLLLDNIEHLLLGDIVSEFASLRVDAAAMIHHLFEQAPDLICLCTSRRRLGIEGEKEYRVELLPQPGQSVTIEQMNSIPSVQLYVDRAQTVKPDFQLTPGNAASIAELCCRLEGLPLSIELAAAWVRTIPPRPMVERLRNQLALPEARFKDIPARHRSLTVVLDCSFALLTAEQLRFLCQLSVFAGGWTLMAAEDVCNEPKALNLLEELQDYSLVVAVESVEGEVRYRFNQEVILEHARGRLLASAESTNVHGRHRDYFLALAETADPELKGQNQKVWLDRLEAEHENLRAACSRCKTSCDGLRVGLRLVGILWRFWWMRGYLSSGREHLQEILDLTEPFGNTKERADALNGAGNLATSQGDFPAACALYEESRSMRREIGDRIGMAHSVNNLGNVAKNQEDYRSAYLLYGEALVLYREIQTLEITSEIHIRAREGEADTLHNLGNLKKEQEDSNEARLLYDNALMVNRALGRQAWQAYNLHGLGHVAYYQQDYCLARTQYSCGLDLNQSKLLRAIILNGIGDVAREEKKYSEASNYSRQALGICYDLGAKLFIAGSLESLAALSAVQFQWDRAVQLWGAAKMLRRKIGSKLVPAEQKKYDKNIAEAKRGLGDQKKFEAVWASGASMLLSQVIEFAMNDV